jgi:hypothetical protein
MFLFLKEVAGRHKGEHVLMFIDQAGWHRSGWRSRRTWGQPSCCPARQSRTRRSGSRTDCGRSIANRVFKDMDTVVDAAVEGLRRMEASPSAMAKLTWRAWM